MVKIKLKDSGKVVEVQERTAADMFHAGYADYVKESSDSAKSSAKKSDG